MYALRFPTRDTLLGIGIAVLATLFINLPLWHALVFTDESTRPDIILESGDEVFYLTRIREAADGHIWAGNPYLKERSDQRYPLGNLWENILAFPMRAFGWSIKTTSIAADALFPFFLVLILWKAAMYILPDKRWRLLLVSTLFLGIETQLWKRPISPQETAILPLLWLWAVCIPSRNSLPITAIRGMLIGLMTLSYPFHWTYCLVAEGLFTLMHLRYDQTWKIRTKRIASVTLPFVIAALPWIIMTISVAGNPEYTLTLQRLGLLTRHLPAGLPLQGYIVACAIAVWLVRRRMENKTTATTLLLLLGAGLIVLNQPLITGKEAEFSSHYRQIIIFPLYLSWAWIAYTVTQKYRILFVALPIIALIPISIWTAQSIKQDWASLETQRTAVETREKTRRLLKPLQEIPGQEVILTEDEFARHFLTIYTAHYPFFTTSAHMYLVDEETLWKRAAVQQALFPDYSIPPRGLVGTSFLNRALYAKTLCRLQSLITFTKGACDIKPESYLPPEWYAFLASNPSREEILQTLEQAHVSYALMRTMPEWLRTHATLVERIDNYELLRFDWSKP